MTQVNDRSQQAIDNLNNKVDQKRLAWENRLLRWLCVVFAVGLVLTLIFNHDPVEKNETDVHVLRDYSGSVGVERSTSESDARRISDVVRGRSPGPTWTF